MTPVAGAVAVGGVAQHGCPFLFPFCSSSSETAEGWVDAEDLTGHRCCPSLRLATVRGEIGSIRTSAGHSPLAEMKKATNNFNEDLRIGVGGTGQGFSEFQAEIEMLSKLRHRHLVSLIGCCLEDSEMIIVYEYMAHGSLCQHLYQSQVPTHGLPWNLRLQICIGAARGFHYLHSEATNHVIIHRGVKSMDILLDSNWDAKIADFGLSLLGSMEENDPVSTTVVGTLGYLDPEYFREGRVSEKSDVYSFGVVLLEVPCARPPINLRLPERNHVSLADWALHCYENDTMEEIIDPHLKGKITLECLKMFAETAAMCLADHGMDRPTMEDVMRNLEPALHLQESTADVPSSTLAQNKPKTAGLGRRNASRIDTSFLPPSHHFSFEHIQIATRNFNESRIIGCGRSSRIYKGCFADTSVAIKVTTTQSVFQTDIMILSKLRHRNLVFLIGFCNENSKMILVYDFVPSDNLRQRLSRSEIPPLPWKTRLHICIDVASTRNYLQNEASSEVIIHRNVKTTNILLHYDYDYEVLCARPALDHSLPGN
ncbi:hypothetical protein ACLOJK_031522 [Asimina triloba]